MSVREPTDCPKCGEPFMFDADTIHAEGYAEVRQDCPKCGVALCIERLSYWDAREVTETNP